MIFDSPQFVYMSATACAGLTILLTFFIILKSERVRRLKSTVGHLQNSLEQIDEQAKLIVRTDLELNKIQEELDKKVSGLYTLQSLSRTLASTLDEKEIFKQIQEEHIEKLGIQKALGVIWRVKEEKFDRLLSFGYSNEELGDIINEIQAGHEAYLKLIKQNQTVSSLTTDIKFISVDEITGIFKVNAFCISPILPQEGDFGFLFVGTATEDIPITEGDEELITILANTIGQALENARLFEKTWKAQQELERRVEQRTRQLTEAVKELELTNKRKNEFVSAVSHELRTPMTSIKGYAAILLGKKLGEIPDAVKERLEKINRHSDELVHMVNDLLDISRIESGNVSMKKEPHTIKSLIDNVLDLLSLPIKNKGISLSIDIPPEAIVMVDKMHVERVFMNLIGNAIKFTPKNGNIRLTTKPADNSFIQINISDDGIGIPKPAQEAIFEEFYRVDNSINDEVKGTGLGLSLVIHIIEAHHGLIWVESESGKGTTFSFLLPLANANKTKSS